MMLMILGPIAAAALFLNARDASHSPPEMVELSPIAVGCESEDDLTVLEKAFGLGASYYEKAFATHPRCELVPENWTGG
jgi:hypothetical protein